MINKKTLYIASFTFLGFLLQIFPHAIIESFYIGLLTSDYALWGLGLEWSSWYIIHHIFTAVLLFMGILFGYWQGKYWWKYIYIDKKIFKKRNIDENFNKS